MLEVTRGYPDVCFDGLFCDSPYGIGFMSKEWDHGVPSVEVWTEVLRTMKPGAWGLVFGGTRTWHRLACALEDAGFELHNTLMWLYGSGFDKSCDISKRIDMAAGAEREVVMEIKKDIFGEREEVSSYGGASNIGRGSTNSYITETTGHATTVVRDTPATPEAKLWDGYGTGLKPAWEPCLLIRKPLEYVTSEELYTLTGWDRFVIESGRDGGKIKHVTHKALREGVDTFRDIYRKNKETKEWVFVRREELGGYKPFRVSTNVVNALKHGCGGLNIDGGRIGTAVVGWGGRPNPIGYSGGLDSDKSGQPRPVQGRWPANLILDEASAAMLDAQSGELHPPGNKKDTIPKSYNASSIEYGVGYKRNVGKFKDSGGASRFFYCAKASPSERNAGLEGFEAPEKTVREVGGCIHTKGIRQAKNHHPTVKPLDLCRYLAKLILPPFREGDPRRLNIPFCGSGSEMIGALQAGWDEVDGCDIDPEYCKIAKARLKFWTRQLKLDL